MPQYVLGETPKSFKKRMEKKSNEKQAAIVKAISQLQDNPRHNALHAAKLSGRPEWYARTSKGDRIFYLIDGNTITFTANCNHDMLRR